MTTENHLQHQVKTVLAEKASLYIQGGNSKANYGNNVDVKYKLDLTQHTDIVEYTPSELCITARAGTPLVALEAELAKHQQMLPFEPPLYTRAATLGGAVATGLSGPRRPYKGAVRDAVLGMKIINGKGEILSFGGQVMKNVAGYDVTRLMTGALGTLGVILEVSLKVIPKPALEFTFMQPCSRDEIIGFFTQLRTSGLPVSASSYINDEVYIRLSGSEKHLGGLAVPESWQMVANGEDFWESIRNHTHPFFQRTDKPLWRLSVPPSSPASARLKTDSLIEWGGSLRWVSSNTPAHIMNSTALKKEGQAVLFHGNLPGIPTFRTPEPALFALHKNLKRKLDPQGIFNPGRLYMDL